MSLAALRAANVSRGHEWTNKAKEVPTASFWGVELAGEVGEVCNKIKKLERERMGMVGSRATIDDLAHEIGDALICLDLLAMHYNIDLDVAMANAFNKKSEELGLVTRISATPQRY